MGNGKQLLLAWSMYQSDNNDRLVQAYHGGDARGASAVKADPRKAPWVSGWLNWQSGNTDNTNELFIRDNRYAALAKYFGNSKNVVRCPADTRVSANLSKKGWVPRARSLSGNIGVGDGNATTGPWSTIYKHHKNMGDFTVPGPSQTWVYIDEHPDSMNDAGFFNPTGDTTIVDLPASYHNSAGGLSFADGHAEIRKWRGAVRAQNAPIRAQSEAESGFALKTAPRAKDPDVYYLSYHGGRVNDTVFGD
jgi:prepilin-type processing-associated H-X9-DG protein